MDGLVNPWAAGTDALLNTLAQRDAQARLEEQRQRQRQLDAEDKADRERMRTHQEAQLRDLHESRLEAAADRQAGIDLRQSEAAAKGAKDFAFQGALQEYRNAPEGSERQKKWKNTLAIEHGIKFEEPKEATPHLVTYKDPKTGKKMQKYVIPKEGDTYESYTEPDKPTGERVDPRTKDNPIFPRGSQQWVDSVLARGGKLEDVVGEVTRGWGQQTQVHPNASLGEAVKYIKGFYGGPTNRPLVGGTAPGGGGGGGADLQAQARQAMEAENARRTASGEAPLDITDAALATVSQRLQQRAGGGGARPAAGGAPAGRPGEVDVDVSQVFQAGGPAAGGAGLGPGAANLRMVGAPGAAPPPSMQMIMTPVQRQAAINALHAAQMSVNPETIQQMHQRLAVQQGPAAGAGPAAGSTGVRSVLTPAQRQQAIATLKINQQPVDEESIQRMYQTLVMQGKLWPASPGR